MIKIVFPLLSSLVPMEHIGAACRISTAMAPAVGTRKNSLIAPQYVLWCPYVTIYVYHVRFCLQSVLMMMSWFPSVLWWSYAFYGIPMMFDGWPMFSHRFLMLFYSHHMISLCFCWISCGVLRFFSWWHLVWKATIPKPFGYWVVFSKPWLQNSMAFVCFWTAMVPNPSSSQQRQQAGRQAGRQAGKPD